MGSIPALECLFFFFLFFFFDHTHTHIYIYAYLACKGLIEMHIHEKLVPPHWGSILASVLGSILALVPDSHKLGGGGGEKRAWYTLNAHAQYCPCTPSFKVVRN